MDARELGGVIRQEARGLVEGLYGELRTNLGTSHYHRLSNEELFRRGQAVFLNLAEWLNEGSPFAIHVWGVELGKKRFAEGIPLGQVILALILEEKHLWENLGRMGLVPDDKLRLQVAEFFARTIYSTALGYEQALSESNRRAQRGTEAAIAQPTPGVMSAKGSTEESSDMTISRGGEIAEHGG